MSKKPYKHGLIYDVNGLKLFSSRQRALDYIVINNIKDAKVRRRVVNESYEGEPQKLVLE